MSAKPQPGSLVVDAIHLGIMGEGYTCAVTFTQYGALMENGMKILHSGDMTAEVVVAPFSHSQSQAGGGCFKIAKQFFYLGFEHILEGLDHLLFLAGVLLVCKCF